MIYMGSKASIAKHILPIVLKDRKEGQWYVEPFAGGMNTICLVDGHRIASDTNWYLIQMWRAIKYGVDMPKDITREMYDRYKAKFDSRCKSDMHITGWVGYMASFKGKFFSGYSGVYTKRNYIKESINNTLRQFKSFDGIEFVDGEYQSLIIPPKSIIYCDPPYKNTTEYNGFSKFNHEAFYEWCKKMKEDGHAVFVSENDMPMPFREVWSMPAKRTLGISTTINTTERLYTI